MDIGIIGAGLAGLSLATLLDPHQHNVVLFDKGQGVGGRLTHRRHEAYDFDHGAQYFTVRSPQFRTFLARHCASCIAPWRARFVSFENNQAVLSRQWQEDHLVGVPSMNALAKTLAKDTTVFSAYEVVEIYKKGEKWHCRNKNDQHSEGFDWLICTAPAWQTRQLMPQGCSFLNELEKIKMKSCFTMMLGFNSSPIDEFDVAHISDEIISWLSCNHTKPQRKTKPSLVINSTNAWADRHFMQDLRTVQRVLLEASERVLNRELKPDYIDLQRWRFANVDTQAGPKAFVDSNLKIAACGDWCIKGRVESAFLSAFNLAQQLQGQGTVRSLDD